MNINFNIPDDYANKFISAARWKIDRPDLSDDRILKKILKQYIENLIDEHTKNIILQSSSSVVNTLKSQSEYCNKQLWAAQEEFDRAKRELEFTYKSVDMGEF